MHGTRVAETLTELPSFGHHRALNRPTENNASLSLSPRFQFRCSSRDENALFLPPFVRQSVEEREREERRKGFGCIDFFLSRCEIGSDSDRPDGCGVEKFKSERAKNRREFFSTTSRQSLIQTTSKNRMYALNIRGTSNISSPLSIYNSSNVTCGNPRVTNLHIPSPCPGRFSASFRPKENETQL